MATRKKDAVASQNLGEPALPPAISELLSKDSDISKIATKVLQEGAVASTIHALPETPNKLDLTVELPDTKLLQSTTITHARNGRGIVSPKACLVRIITKSFYHPPDTE